MSLQSIISSEWSLSLDEQGKIVQGLDDIAQCIKVIIMTRKGTVPLYPEFGCGAFDFVDKPVNFAIPNMTREIISALQQFEPRAEIKSVRGKVTEQSNITFNIIFSLVDTIQTGQLDVTYGIT